MPYFCKKCGEKEEFYGSQSYTTYGYCTADLNAEGETQDQDNYNDDSTDYGDVDDVKCQNCDADVEWYNDEDEMVQARQEFEREEASRRSWKAEMER
jgi:hypothetical protein